MELQVRRAARAFPAVVLTGPRRAGKTSMLRHLYPRAQHFLLEDPTLVARLRTDPTGFLDEIRTPAILDEIQNAPELFAMVRARIDARPRATGQWFLTGSQESPLMRGVTESMAGRAAILSLPPLSARECDRVSLLAGGYPEAVARPRSARLWFASYIQTYLERDVRAALAVRDLATFRKFLALVASRHGQILNRTDIAAPLGVSVPTISDWLGVLEITAQLILVPPFHENLGKRLIKSPKIYIADPGLACHLLGIESGAELARSPFLGPIFEGFIASEILKAQANSGRRRELYHFRDAQGLEVDFLFPSRSGGFTLLECKAASGVHPRTATPLHRLASAFRERAADRGRLDLIVTHQPPRTPIPTTALAPGTRALPWPQLLPEL